MCHCRFFFLGNFYIIHVANMSSINILDNKLMTEDDMDMGFQHLPIIKIEEGNENDNNLTNTQNKVKTLFLLEIRVS